MILALLLLLFGKAQDSFTDRPTWHFAIMYAVVGMLLTLAFGAPFLFTIMMATILGLYAWGYFALLRHFVDNLLLWLAIFLLGALLPLALSFFGG